MTVGKPPVSLIVAALVPKLGIGYKGGLPWKLKQEMKYFKQVTSHVSTPGHSNVVIMGRKTWESIPQKFRPLPNRINVVLTRDREALTKQLQSEIQQHPSQLIVSSSVSDSIKELSVKIGLDKIENIFIIGGAEIYNDSVAKGVVDHVLLTEVSSEKETELDTFLKIPIYDENNWGQADLGEYLKQRGIEGFQAENEEGDFKYRFTLYNKK